MSATVYIPARCGILEALFSDGRFSVLGKCLSSCGPRLRKPTGIPAWPLRQSTDWAPMGVRTGTWSGNCRLPDAGLWVKRIDRSGNCGERVQVSDVGLRVKSWSGNCEFLMWGCGQESGGKLRFPDVGLWIKSWSGWPDEETAGFLMLACGSGVGQETAGFQTLA